MITRNGQSGLSLIEVLIALAVVSIGLAGMAAMQLTTLQFVHSAHYRSMASTVALDFEERLWLELADDSVTGCPEAPDVRDTIDELLAHWNRDYVGGEGGDAWNWSSARMLKVPNLEIDEIDPDELDTSMSGVTEIPVTLTWCESRFTDLEGEDATDQCPNATVETFTYNVRILCRPAEET